MTGGAGFIGSHLVDRLLADGHEVDRRRQLRPVLSPRRSRKPTSPRRRRTPAAAWSSSTSATREAVDALVQRQPPGRDRPPGGAGRGPAEHRRPGALRRGQRRWEPSVWLEAACRLEPRPRFVYASSSSVYGDRPDAPFRETDPVDLPVSPYAATKKACELLAHTFHHLHGLPVTGLRFFTAYGPRNRPDLAIAKFTRLIDRGEPVPMFGDGTTRRDYTYVDDIVDGIVRAIDRCTGSHLYNLGNSEPIELRDMIDALGERLGQAADHRATCPSSPATSARPTPTSPAPPASWAISPPTPFHEGLARYVAWRRAAKA